MSWLRLDFQFQFLLPWKLLGGPVGFQGLQGCIVVKNKKEKQEMMDEGKESDRNQDERNTCSMRWKTGGNSSKIIMKWFRR